MERCSHCPLKDGACLYGARQRCSLIEQDLRKKEIDPTAPTPHLDRLLGTPVQQVQQVQKKRTFAELTPAEKGIYRAKARLKKGCGCKGQS